jgi:hypothetical protein
MIDAREKNLAIADLAGSAVWLIVCTAVSTILSASTISSFTLGIGSTV